MTGIPGFARQWFSKPVRRLRVSDVHSPVSGWAKAPRDLRFTTSLAIRLVAGGTTQVRLRSRREWHDVSILEESILRPVA
jgi:hypothetical protein